MEQIKKIIDWCKKHIVTTCFIVIHFILSIIFLFIPVRSSIFQSAINVFMTQDLSVSVLNIMFSLLFSGIEISIGSFQYGLWLLWSACFLFCFRNFILSLISFSISKTDTKLMVGPTYAVFSVYLTFVFVHRPIICFKVCERFKFTDTFLYSIAVFQYILYKIPDHFYDFLLCCISNIVWKIMNLIFSYIEIRCQQEAHETENVNDERVTQLQL